LRRRCLIVADGFFEWQKLQRGKQPWFFTVKRAARVGGRSKAAKKP